MLSSITPLGERGRAARWGRTVTAYLAGSTAAGAALGAPLGWFGALLPWSVSVRLVVLATGCALGLALDLLGRRPPSWRRQVDERWLDRYRDWVYGAGYGVQLGLGVVTIVTSAVVYVALLAALTTGSPAEGAAVGATFGAVRALPVLLARRVTTPDALAALHRRLGERLRAARALAVGAQAASGVALLGVAVVVAR